VVVVASTDEENRLVRFNRPIVRREIAVDSKNLDVVREGTWMVVNWEYGTAKNVALPDVDMVRGETALERYAQRGTPVDLLVTDVVMPASPMNVRRAIEAAEGGAS